MNMAGKYGRQSAEVSTAWPRHDGGGPARRTPRCGRIAGRLCRPPRAQAPFLWQEYPMSDLWRRCLERLEGELSAEDVQTWLMPLQAREDAHGLFLYAPNPYSLDTVREQYLDKIQTIAEHLIGRTVPVRLEVGSSGGRPVNVRTSSATPSPAPSSHARTPEAAPEPPHVHNLDPHYTFETFVEGKSNQLGKAAAMQVAMNPGRAYNPLLLYGGTGLGKTHLMHAAGNMLMQNNPR